ncbi:MAG TPA: hypothetical protein VNO30_41470 [Kofleriaceae bacterium]|nr:hypothetical protein [Kofleriaceae bacterium]
MTDAYIDISRYAPQISVQVAGKSFEQLSDVLELRVTLQKDELSGFSMLVANELDLESQQFRYSDASVLDVFEPVEIQMGYAGPGGMATMFVGEITALQPSFPSSGLPTINVTGTDMLGRLRRAKPGAEIKKSFDGPDWQIASEIAQRHGLTLSGSSSRTGPVHKGVMQRDMDDLQFLLYLAKRNNFEAAIVIEHGEAKLYFGKPREWRREGKAPVRLAWGQSLVSFTPRLSVGGQVSKVTVRGWNARTKEKIEYTAELKDLPRTGKGAAGAELLERKAGAKDERIVDRVVQSQEEAKQLAIELLSETANQFLTGNGEAMGDPAIRPLAQIELGGLGPRYNGKYDVTKTDHVFGASGYMTTFEVERMREGA